MGMYTELHLNVEIIKELPEGICDTLRYMTTGNGELDTLPYHSLFRDGSRWEYMLRCDSYYFSADTLSTFRWDENGDSYYLCIRCNLKNYGGEIRLFLHWIHPYIAAIDGDFLGFFRYEETNTPTLIYYRDSGIEFRYPETFEIEPCEIDPDETIR